MVQSNYTTFTVGNDFGSFESASISAWILQPKEEGIHRDMSSKDFIETHYVIVIGFVYEWLVWEWDSSTQPVSVADPATITREEVTRSTQELPFALDEENTQKPVVEYGFFICHTQLGNSVYGDMKRIELGTVPHCCLTKHVFDPLVTDRDICETLREVSQNLERLFLENHGVGCWDTRFLKQMSPFLQQPEKKTGARPSSKLKDLRTMLDGLQDQFISTEDVRTYMGARVHEKFGGEEINNISCYSAETLNNFLLRWISSKRAGVRLPERLLDFKWGKTVAGPVRNQFLHELCWAFVVVDLVSAARVIENLDREFTMLSVKELCFFASPEERARRTGAHKCHSMYPMDGMNYVIKHGVGRHYGLRRGYDLIKIKDALFIGDNLHKALKRLIIQPIGATIVQFSPEYETTGDGIYRGPTSNDSVFTSYHSVMVVAAYMVDGELVLECKSSEGQKMHNKGYLKVSATTMVMGVNFNRGPSVTCGVKEDANEDDYELEEPTPLISGFFCPMFNSSEFVRRR